MPHPRQKIKKDPKRRVVIGKFHALAEPGNTKNIPQADLCTFDELLYYDPETKKRPRPDASIERLIEERWEKKHQELLAKRNEEEIREQERKKPKTIYWLFDRFLEHVEQRVKSGKRSKDTFNQYKRAIDYYKNAHIDHPIERRFFNDSEIDKFIGVMSESGCNDRTIWKHVVAIKGILSWGYRQYDEKNHRIVSEIIDFDLPKKPKSVPVLYTTEEVLALENRILQEYSERLSVVRLQKEQGRGVRKMTFELLGIYLIYKAFFLVKNTGMRVGEVLHLPYDHIHLDRGEIIIAEATYQTRLQRKSALTSKPTKWYPKGNKTRRIIDISQNKTLIDFLRFDFENKSPNETLFLGDGTGRLYFTDTSKLTRAVRRIISKIDTNKDVKPFHSLRGWAITWLLSQGISIPEVQNMVGHEEVSTTIGYFNLMKNSSGKSIGKLGNLNETLIDRSQVLEFVNIQIFN